MISDANTAFKIQHILRLLLKRCSDRRVMSSAGFIRATEYMTVSPCTSPFLFLHSTFPSTLPSIKMHAIGRSVLLRQIISAMYSPCTHRTILDYANRLLLWSATRVFTCYFVSECRLWKEAPLPHWLIDGAVMRRIKWGGIRRNVAVAFLIIVRESGDAALVVGKVKACFYHSHLPALIKTMRHDTDSVEMYLI